MSRAGVRTVQGTADVVIGLTWNARAKAWDVRAARADGGPLSSYASCRIASTAALDPEALVLLVEVLRAEMEQWLF